MPSQSWIDSHVHIADLRWGVFPGEAVRVIQKSQEMGAKALIQAGYDFADWQRQKQLKTIFPDFIYNVYGLHPYWVSRATELELENGMDLLAQNLHEAQALGEAGLDFRPHIVGDQEALQYRAFEMQMELAQFSGKPMVLHLVRAFKESLHFFDVWGVPPHSAMVHSFNGSVTQAEAYLKLGFKLSVGGPLLREDNLKLQQAVAVIPLESLLIESDGPDQAGPHYQGQLNPPWSVLDVAQQVADIKKIEKSEVVRITRENALNFFQVL